MQLSIIRHILFLPAFFLTSFEGGFNLFTLFYGNLLFFVIFILGEKRLTKACFFLFLYSVYILLQLFVARNKYLTLFDSGVFLSHILFLFSIHTLNRNFVFGVVFLQFLYLFITKSMNPSIYSGCLLLLLPVLIFYSEKNRFFLIPFFIFSYFFIVSSSIISYLTVLFVLVRRKLLLVPLVFAVILIKAGEKSIYVRELEGVITSRICWLKAGVNMFKDSPVYGIGSGNFGNSYRKYKTCGELSTTYAHSSYLQVISECGIVGFLIFSIFIYLFLNEVENRYFRYGVYFFLIYNIFEYSMLVPFAFRVFLLMNDGKAFALAKKFSLFLLLGVFLMLNFLQYESELNYIKRDYIKSIKYIKFNPYPYRELYKSTGDINYLHLFIKYNPDFIK